MAEIAAGAGVSRQTVYAHFSSREALLVGVAEMALAEALAAIDAARPEEGPPAEALGRLVDAWWETVSRYALVLEGLAAAYPTSEELHALHAPILKRLERLISRGRRSGDFDRAVPAKWLAAAFLGLVHSTADQVAAGVLGRDEAAAALRRVVPRVFGVDAAAD